MPKSLHLRVLDQDVDVFESPLAEPLELGRQRQEELAHDLYALLPATAGTPARLLIARKQEGNVSRQHALLEPLPSGSVRVSNRSQIPLPFDNAAALAPGTSRELTPPFCILLPPRTVEVSADGADEHGCQSLEESPTATSSMSTFATLSGAFLPAGKELFDWLHATMSVLRSSTGAVDFLERAAAALVRIVGLDSGRLLLLEGDRWTVKAAHDVAGAADKPWHPSKYVLRRLCADKRAVWQRPRQATEPDSASLMGTATVVAAPLLDAQDRVIGALYGERRQGTPAPPQAGGKIEALLVDLLACAVSTGLARQEQEKAAVKASALFEQFFTRKLAQTLGRQPDLLNSREAEVTLLFCDVRGFSAVSERLGPGTTIRWMNEVMGVLSGCVQAEEGVLVDYIGDELFAMWGAPEAQPDQAARAVRAALAMLDALAALNQRWRGELGKDMGLGVGINSGLAQVGNTGSHLKFKYGPLGNSVNLASRVQGLTKYLRCRFLVTRSTRRQLGDDFIARRVVKARVVNIEAPVDLYQVERATPERAAFFRASEEALEALEARDFATAARGAGALLPEHRGDGALLLILSRASTALMNDGEDFQSVWVPPGK